MDTTKLDPGAVIGAMEDIQKAAVALSAEAEGGFAPIQALESKLLIKEQISDTISMSLATIKDDTTTMTENVLKYVDAMMVADGQASALDGSQVDNPYAGDPTDPSNQPSPSPSGSGGPGGGGGGVPPVEPPPFDPPIPPPILIPPSENAEYGIEIAANFGSMMDLLNEIAASKGATLEQLLTDPQFKTYLNDILQGGKILVDMAILEDFKTPEAMQAWLKNIYNGEEVANITNPVIDFVRMRLDSIAKAKGVTDVQTLFDDTKYAKELQENVIGLGKVNKFLSMIEGKSQSVIQSIYNGEVYEAYGFKQENLVKLKEVIDKTPDLLKPENAAKLKGALDTIDPTKTLSAIYSNAPAETVNTVVNNLYKAVPAATPVPDAVPTGV